MTSRFSPERLTSARGDRRREALAAAAGVSTDTIKNWEKGVCEPDASKLKAIADLTGKPLDYFFLPQTESAA